MLSPAATLTRMRLSSLNLSRIIPATIGKRREQRTVSNRLHLFRASLRHTLVRLFQMLEHLPREEEYDLAAAHVRGVAQTEGIPL